MAEHIGHLFEGDTLPHHLGGDRVPENMGTAMASRQARPA
jgi:hypothetical protein